MTIIWVCQLKSLLLLYCTLGVSGYKLNADNEIKDEVHPGVSTEWGNQTAVREFVLLGFRNISEIQVLLFPVFLAIYILTMVGNILILVLIVVDHHLHTPMYFFLGNLSCLETCYTSSILPRMLASFVTGDETISFSGCFTQYFFFGLLSGTECYLLAAMSYDRYLAICKPLHYASLMNGRFCLQLAAMSWTSSFLAISITILLMLNLTFCGPNEMDHFFCDFIPIVKLSCSDTFMLEVVAAILLPLWTFPPFLLTMTSYICIIATILKISSTTKRQKAFSTCSSHLTVVTIFYGTVFIVYMVPKKDTLRDLDKAFSFFYTVLTPLINPFIYSLRNKEVKEALTKVVAKFCVVKETQTSLCSCFQCK
ncbi:olfactory receptor 2AP1-like [Alligator sinensis]|uniref:Olfactory receptor n=1 Tax=Alligator sinensis TaxID=38654 RepID=A0A1U8DM32_ALLSI|nr:olfactory receptor 2AP1-like [Alligator sinensis]